MEARVKNIAELRGLIGGGTAEEAEAKAVALGGGPAEALDALFALYEGAFVPENASGVQGEFQFNVTTAAGTQEYTVAVGDGKCQARRGAAASATAVTTVGLGDLLLLSVGEATGFQLSAEKRLSTEGNLGAAIGFKDWFKLG
ncbi:SCP2 sterol-binding domain-containing protein [Kitasatospora sp. NPDC050543]|uniref:SCP2 sterol-binding domain-containing protein n=1 Tax=Kitasatospora sp. NPDC050543 TaxID=3364054 RepID=UPI00379AF864